jgi:hypothetical protein
MVICGVLLVTRNDQHEKLLHHRLQFPYAGRPECHPRALSPEYPVMASVHRIWSSRWKFARTQVVESCHSALLMLFGLASVRSSRRYSGYSLLHPHLLLLPILSLKSQNQTMHSIMLSHIPTSFRRPRPKSVCRYRVYYLVWRVSKCWTIADLRVPKP